MAKLLLSPPLPLNIKNIIFDLGGVILDIDYSRTLNEFKKLGVDNLENFFTLNSQAELFNRLDCGQISAIDFVNELRHHLSISATNAEITQAWNALLLEWDTERLSLVEELRKNYRIYLLSNTNIIHSTVYNGKLAKLTKGKNLKDYFDKVYYSYEVGMRKPNPEIFQLVVEENKLTAHETLFIDDTLQHIEAAKKMGLYAYHLQPKEGETIVKLFG